MTERCSETYWKKLIGNTDMEDALKRLDTLTEEEVRIINAENLRATCDVENKVSEAIRGV